MPWEESESRKRSYSDSQDFYAGPEEFMEPGVRGFLVTTLPNKEELALDQAMKMLRKASVKLHGGMKPAVKSTTALFAHGYIAIDFMDPESVTVFPNPEAKAETQEEKDKAEEDNTQESTEVKETSDGDKKDSLVKTDDVEKGEKMETEGQDDEGKKEENDEGKKEEDTTDVKEETNEDEKKEKKDGSENTKEQQSKSDGESVKSKTDSQKSKSKREDDRKHKDKGRRRRDEDAVPKWPLMRPIQNFKAFRTEFRNIMFIKSDVPDPKALAAEVMDLVAKRKPLKSEAINQLLPVQGICNYDYWEVEVMARRVLAPFFPVENEEASSFGIMVFDKLSDPGTDVLPEILRTAIWSINPMAWQANPTSEPDVTIHVELIGSKIILSAMNHYMKYRLYSPLCVAELGEGKCEDSDDEKGNPGKDSARQRSDRKRRRSRSRSRSERPQKKDESGKGKDKGSQSKPKDGEKDTPKKSEKESTRKSDREKKGEKDDAKKGEKEKKNDKEDAKKEEEKVEMEDVKDDEPEKNTEKELQDDSGEKMEVGEEKPQEETDEPSQEEEKKSTPKRGGRRSAAQKKK